MKISKRIKLNNNYYYLIVDVEYKKRENNLPILCLKNYKEDYWDGGDFSILIEKIEEAYTLEKAEKYDENISYMADILFIYDRVPFISGVKDIAFSKKDNVITYDGYISKDDIESYIKMFNIKMYNNINFKLYDERTWML